MSTIIRQSAEEAILSWEAAVARRDLDAVMAAYAEPLLIFDVVGPLQRMGLDTYRKAWREEFFPWHGDAGKFELDQLSVHAADDIAFATALIDCAGTENGRAVAYTLRLTLGLKRTSAGWRIVHEHSSEPTPVDAAEGSG